MNRPTTPCLLLLNKSHFASYFEQQGWKVFVAITPEEYSPGRTDSWSLLRNDIPFTTGESLLSIISRVPQPYTPDLVIYHDDSRAALRVRESHLSQCPTIFYSVDAHIHSSWHSQMSGVFDYVMVAQRDFLAEYKRYHDKVQWLPLWCPSRTNYTPTRSRGACFRGNLYSASRQGRLKFFTQVASRAPIDFAEGASEEVYRTAKIILNEAISQDLNFRVFEALGAGALLITPRVESGLLEIFQDKVHLVTYAQGNAEEASQLVNYYLQHEEERAQIATAGYQRLISAHLEEHRAREIEQVFISLSEGKKRNRPLAFYSAAYRDVFGAVHYGEEEPLSSTRILEIAATLSQHAVYETIQDSSTVYMVLWAISILELFEQTNEALQLVEIFSQQEGQHMLIFALIGGFLLRKYKGESAAHSFLERYSSAPQELLAQSESLIAELQRNNPFLSEVIKNQGGSKEV